MKRKPKKPLSPLQQKRLLRIFVAAVLLAGLWLIFAPGQGLLYLHQQKKRLALLEAEQAQMIQDNTEMTQAIERLQDDRQYLEQVAREEYGMVKENEMVFDFAKKKKGKKKE